MAHLERPGADGFRAQCDTVSALERERGQVVRAVFVRGHEPIKSFYKWWRMACKATGLEGRIVHDFRRSAVRNLVRAGVSEHVAMQLTGHKTRSVFDRYDIVNEADLTAGVAKLATFHAQPVVRRDVLPMRKAGAA